MTRAGKPRKHVPQRTCIACRTVKPKRAMTRVVATPDEGVQIDPTGKRAGRGAYLCDLPACWERALQTDLLSRALRTTLTNVDVERLREAAPKSSAA